MTMIEISKEDSDMLIEKLKIINDAYGPFMRYCFIITDAALETDPPFGESLCDGCMACAVHRKRIKRCWVPTGRTRAGFSPRTMGR